MTRMNPNGFTWWAGIFLMLGACDTCAGCGHDSIAELVKTKRTVQRDHATEKNQWQGAERGDEFVLNDGVRTLGGASADLVLTGGGGIQLGPNTLIRFLAKAPGRGRHRLSVEEGAVTLESGNEDLQVNTHLGVAVLRPKTKLQITADDAQMQLQVVVGRVSIEGQNDVNLTAGQRLTVRVGGVIIEEPKEDRTGAKSNEPEPLPEDPNALAAEEDSARDSGDAIPKHADFSIAAGETATVHDAAAPTAIRVRFGNACSGEGVVEVSNTRSFHRLRMASPGKGSAIIEVAPGNNRYRVRCRKGAQALSEVPVAAGSLLVRRDTGAQRLPKKAPYNTLEADGRRYTVMFQNLLPQLTFVWPRASQSGGTNVLVLEVLRSHKQQRFAVDASRLTLPSGKVTEGLYRWWFEDTTTKKRSPVTTLQLQFDNAAPAASIQEPSGSIPLSQGQAVVSGTAVDSATVSVSGAPLATDSQFRFRGLVPLPKDEHALSIRIAHPQYGVHYYLRPITR